MSDDARPTRPETPVNPPVAALPNDPLVLQQMIIELLAALRDTRRQNEELQHRLDLLLRRLYGPRTERFDPNQPLLIPDAFEPPAPESSEKGDTAPPKPEPDTAPPKTARPHGRRPLPKNLPRVSQVYELTAAERRCPECGATRTQIGSERSEQLDYQPASLFVVDHVRCTYACPHCEGQVVTASKPAQPIDKGLPGPGLMAYVVTSKYCDHLPLYRLERILKRQGVELSRSTLCDWTAATAKMLEPLYDLMKTLVLLSAVIHTDDTSVKVRDSERKIKATGRLWGYFGDHTQPVNVFDFSMSHKRDGPNLFLKGFRGHLQADAFSGYDGIYTGGDVIEVGCNAHARRKFVEAQKTDPARATVALGYYRELYAIEAAIKDEVAKLPEETSEPARISTRLRIRLARAVPVLEEFHKWLEAQRHEVLPKSPIGIAIGYTLNNWEALARYAKTGELSIDNNVSEQQMKTIAIGRKNWLFTGSENGGKTMAVLFSLVSTCVRHGHDPFAYLRDVLARLPDHPHDDRAALLPQHWSPPKVTEPSATPDDRPAPQSTG